MMIQCLYIQTRCVTSSPVTTHRGCKSSVLSAVGHLCPRELWQIWSQSSINILHLDKVYLHLLQKWFSSLIHGQRSPRIISRLIPPIQCMRIGSWIRNPDSLSRGHWRSWTEVGHIVLLIFAKHKWTVQKEHPCRHLRIFNQSSNTSWTELIKYANANLCLPSEWVTGRFWGLVVKRWA